MSLRGDILRFSVLGLRSDIRIELQAPVLSLAKDSLKVQIIRQFWLNEIFSPMIF